MSLLVETSPNETAQRLTGRDYLSYSAVSTYAGCPLRYFFRYVAGLPERTVSSSLAFGGGIHAALELWFDHRMAGSPSPDHDTLLGAFWDAWREKTAEKTDEAAIHFGKGEDVNSIGHLADRVLTAFCESPLAEPEGNVIGVEEELRGEMVPGVPDLLARVDLLVETDEALTITDFKTAAAAGPTTRRKTSRNSSCCIANWPNSSRRARICGWSSP